MIELSVAICTYNREKYLPQLFGSIIKQSLSPERYEVVIVDNNSTDSTAELCADFHSNYPNIHYMYVREENQGLSFARNRSIREASSPLIVFLDDDAYPAPDYFEGLLRAFKEDPSAAAVGGKILLHYESVIPDWENKYLNSLMGFYDPGDTPFVYRTKDYPRGSNMAFRSTIFDEVGGFNTKLGRIGRNLIGGEEKDIFYRIYQDKRYKVLYDPTLVVYHSVPPERTTREFIKRQAYQTGMSERIRSRSEGALGFLKRFGIEALKWGASIILYFRYLLSGQGAKGSMIVYFRRYVTKGLLSSSKTD